MTFRSLTLSIAAIGGAVLALQAPIAAAQTDDKRGVPGVELNVGRNASDRGVPGVEMNVGRDGDQRNRGVPGVETNVGRDGDQRNRGVPGVEMNVGRDGDQRNLAPNAASDGSTRQARADRG